MSRWKYQFSYDRWSQASWAQPVFRWIKLSGDRWVPLSSNQGVKPTGLLRETGNWALEADPRIHPDQKMLLGWALFMLAFIWRKKNMTCNNSWEGNCVSLLTASLYVPIVGSFFTKLESLNLREGQPQPGTGFGLSPLFWGMVWTHSSLVSFRIWEQTETAMLPAAKIFPHYLKLVHEIPLSLATSHKWRQRPYT